MSNKDCSHSKVLKTINNVYDVEKFKKWLPIKLIKVCKSWNELSVCSFFTINFVFCYVLYFHITPNTYFVET